MKQRIILAAICGLLAPPAIAQATLLVPSQYPTIQAAIGACVNGDAVLVAPGVYPAINFNGKAINVHSSGGATVTTIQGTPGAQVVVFSSNEGPASVLDGFTVTGGAGVLILNSSPTIQNCRIVNNVRTGPGGGILCTTAGAGVASPTISACTISNNLSVNANNGISGAGLAFYGQSSATSFPTITNCSIASNASTVGSGPPGQGGGIAITGKWAASFTGCTVTGNFTPEVGGACFIGAGSGSFTSCTFIGNHGTYGGALFLSNGSVSLTNCLIADNFASFQCGAIYSSSSNSQPQQAITIKNCTIAANTAAQAIGGLAMFGSGLPALSISNSILWGNSGTDIESLTAGIAYSNVGFGLYAPGVGTISADPLFVDAGRGDYHLSTPSPCRNAGAPATVGLPATDLDGGSRVVGAVVDMGSDEIPALAYPGTADGLDLYARINGVSDPLASTRTGSAGDLLTVRMASPNGVLVGGLPLFGARLYFTGNSFPVPGGGIWLDSQSTIVYGALLAPPFGFPGFPPGGLEFNFTVPPGLSGRTVRMQGLVSSINALNGIYATTNATEVTF